MFLNTKSRTSVVSVEESSVARKRVWTYECPPGGTPGAVFLRGERGRRSATREVKHMPSPALSPLGAIPPSEMEMSGGGGVGNDDVWSGCQLEELLDAADMDTYTADEILERAGFGEGSLMEDAPAKAPSALGVDASNGGAIAPMGLSNTTPQDEGGMLMPAALCPEIGIGPYAGLKLLIENHQFGHEISDGELFVTNLKKFEVNVALVTQNNIGLELNKTLHLQVSLIFESGLLVLKNDQLPQNGPPLTGLNEAHSIDGRAKFTLKAAPWVTSDKLKRQRFRLLIEPVDEAIRRDCPALTLRSQAFKIVVKTPTMRAGLGSQGQAAAAPAAALAAAPAAAPTTNNAAATDDEVLAGILAALQEQVSTLRKDQQQHADKVVKLEQLCAQQQLEIEMLKKRSAADPPETERRQPSQRAVGKKRRRDGDGEGEQAAAGGREEGPRRRVTWGLGDALAVTRTYYVDKPMERTPPRQLFLKRRRRSSTTYAS